MGANQTSTTNQQQTQTANPVAQAALTPFGQIGLNVAQTPYNAAMNPQVAAQNQQQLSAISGLGGLQTNNPASPFINQANQYSQTAADPNNVTAMAQQFYNPMSQQVLNQLGNVFGQQSAQLQGNEAASGSIGGSRASVANSTLANQQGLAAGQTLAGLQQQALNAAQTQQGQISQQAFTQGQLGNEALNTGLTGINAALQGGNLTQAQQQAIINDTQIGAIQQTLFPQQEAAAGENIAMGTTALGGTTTGQGTTTQPVNYLGQILGGVTAGAGLIASDERVKENIEPIGKSFDKQTIYKFNYIGDPSPRIGLMAQEVEKKHPGAVKEINGIKAVDYNKATAKSAEMGEHRQHRAIGGGTGVGLGDSGIAALGGLQSGGLSFGPIQSGLAPYFAQSPQVNVPQSHFPTINLNPQQNTAQQQQNQQAQQFSQLGTALGKSGIGSNIADAFSTPDFGGGSDFARGGRIHRGEGGGIDADPNSIQAANDAFLADNQGFGLGLVPPANAAIAPSNQWQPSIETAPQKLIQNRLQQSPPEATAMGAQSAIPGSGQYIPMGYDGRPIGAPQKPIQDRLTQPPALSSDTSKDTSRLDSTPPPIQQAAIASPAQTPPPSIPAADRSKPDWGDIPHTPQLMNDRQRFAEELRQNPALRQKYLTISLQEQNDPTGNLAIFESAMNRASVNHTTLAQELKMHATEGGYYGGPYRPELLNNPHYKQMAELNLERALNGSNVAKYGTDNSSGDFGRIRNSNGMYTPTAAYNGEYISYPSRSDARGYNGFPEWLNNVGGSIEGGLNQFAGSVRNAGQQVSQGIQGIFGGNKPSVLNDPSLQPPKPGESNLDKYMKAFGMDMNQPQGLGGSLGRALGQQPLMSQDLSNALVRGGFAAMASPPTVGVKGFPGAALSALNASGKGGLAALEGQQQERAQVINMANAAMNQKLHEAQIRHYNMEAMKPFVARTTAETVVDPTTGMVIGTKNINHYAQFDENGHMHFVDENGQPSTPGAAPSTQKAALPDLDTIPGTGDELVKSLKQSGYSPTMVDEADKVAHYRSDPRQIASRSRHEQLFIDRLAHRINEDYEPQRYQGIVGAQKAMDAGDVRKALGRIGQLFDEVETTHRLSQESGNWHSWPAPETRNYVAGHFMPSVDYQAKRAALGTQINNVTGSAAAVAKGSGVPAQREAESRAKNMSVDAAPEVLQTALKTEGETALKFGQSQLNGVNHAKGLYPDNKNYESIMGRLSESQKQKAIKVLGQEKVEEITGRPLAMDLRPVTQAQIAKLHSGDHFVAADDPSQTVRTKP